MAAEERDETGEWLLPVDGGPPTLYELEQRVEIALTVARAAETAALEIGAASVEAAQEARRAAELAQRASLAAELAQRVRPVTPEEDFPSGPALEIESAPEPEAEREPEPDLDMDPFQERLLAFRERAERVSVRLQRLDHAAPISSS